jgi:hypothetical protein
MLEDLMEFMSSPQKLVKIRNHAAIFDQYDRQEIISALRNAEVVAEQAVARDASTA